MRAPKRTALAVVLWCAGASVAQTPPPDYKVDKDHPRLLLNNRRLTLLRREKQRETIRWEQFNTLVAGKVQMLEPGFAFGLYYLVSGNEEVGRQAVQWALGASGTDLRQLALVFDWCEPVMQAAEKDRLAAKIVAALGRAAAADDMSTVRARVMAAIALSGTTAGIEDKYVKPVVEQWWKKKIVDPLAAGTPPMEPRDHYAAVEMLHVLRDVYDVDLREAAPKYFATLPVFHILAHYPAPYPAGANDYRIPLMASHGEPDLKEAVLSRAAGLAMVSLDTNSQETAFLQGWLIQDRFLMRSPLGIPYEFLWANPYQPGLSFHYLPNIFHDEKTGRLVIRSAWEDDATWFYQSGGQMQMFSDGQVKNLKQEAMTAPLAMGNTVLLPSVAGNKFSVNATEPMHYIVIGLKPETAYDLEVDDEELREVKADRGGVIELSFPAERKTTVRLRQYVATAPAAPAPAR